MEGWWLEQYGMSLPLPSDQTPLLLIVEVFLYLFLVITALFSLNWLLIAIKR